MTSTTQIILQLVGFLLQAGNALTNVVSDKWKPVVLGIVALAQIVLARLGHNYNPDGTPSTVAYVKQATLLLALLLLPGLLYAQTAPAVTVNAFSVTAAPITLPGKLGTTTGGALTGVTLGITNSLSLRQTNFVSGDATLKGYFGGADYIIPKFSPWLNKISPNLNGYNFKLEATGSAGATQTPNGSHVGFLFGGRLSYAVAGSSTYSLALEIQDLNTPGLAKRNNLVISVGPKITF